MRFPSGIGICALGLLVVACGTGPTGEWSPLTPMGEPPQVAQDGGTARVPVVPLEKTDARGWPVLQDSIPTLEISISPTKLEQLRKDPYLPEQPATFTFQGVRKKALFRVRGGSSRSYVKKSWRIECLDEPCIGGRKKLNLLSEQADRTFLVEKLGYDLLAALGAPSPRTQYVRLSINGRYEGLYLDVERIDKAFVKARYGFSDKDASIYRCGSQDCEMKLWRASYQAPWEKATNESEPDDELQAFLAQINQTTDRAFVSAMESSLDVDSYLATLVMDALIANDIVMDSGSYWIFDDNKHRWTYVPWDLNNSAARWWPSYQLGMAPYSKRPIPIFAASDPRVEFFYNQRSVLSSGEYFPAFSSLTTRFTSVPRLRSRYFDTLEEALKGPFQEAHVQARIEQMHQLIRAAVQSDPYVNRYPEGQVDPDGYAKFVQGLPYMKRYVSERVKYLRTEIQRMKAQGLGVAVSRINVPDKIVEIRNYGTQTASLASMFVSTDLRRTGTNRTSLPSLNLGPGQTAIVKLSRLPNEGELGLFRSGNLLPIDAVFYGRVSQMARSESPPWQWNP